MLALRTNRPLFVTHGVSVKQIRSLYLHSEQRALSFSEEVNQGEPGK